MTPADLLLRPAGPEDAPGVVAVHLASRAAAVAAGTMPPAARPEAEVRRWLTERLRTDETWVAEVDGEVVGYLRLVADWIDDLYVAPTHANQGIGGLLLDLAKQRCPHGLGLWVFEINTPARRFYARHGLVEVEHTDGSDNEERQPDLRMEWAPA
ncbi:GNAT family N-acetyltransferase [Nocardioides sp. dk4132]|uniref:GNAT family N-acetyltransferase n=1 Tax=unclassified Nocardioides TaxID=2615069 RepID=UPI0012971B62|nr:MULTISPECIES: GNAT family N-acetyltransferase [unclassified Nocardioides]MQW76453.1 GNAT family N-acetyltransferase [Nocardioides sp. dk4132]QGA07278.1 GNAT family N-acetyltransferase [Nocardioides sp. dk884]